MPTMTFTADVNKTVTISGQIDYTGTTGPEVTDTPAG